MMNNFNTKSVLLKRISLSTTNSILNFNDSSNFLSFVLNAHSNIISVGYGLVEKVLERFSELI